MNNDSTLTGVTQPENQTTDNLLPSYGVPGEPNHSDDEILQLLRERLHSHHLKMLIEESGISPDTIYERGYMTATDPKALRELGFSDTQSRLVLALLVPIHGPTGGIVLHQLRPDNPRLD
jgi:hypothetical protein